MKTQTVLSKLRNVKRSGKGWSARCPAHSDAHNSLSVGEGDNGQVLLTCHAGCEFEDICAALGNTRQIVAAYNYVDERGTLLFQQCRTESKKFFTRRPDGKGSYINGLGGIRTVPYRLPELLEANLFVTVFVVEGEKDADALWEHGLVATCNPFGADNWKDHYSDALAGRSVVVLPDNDEPGRKHARKVARSLSGKAANVKI
ncbi:MAG: hypothetical protein H0W99_14180, partial [Acidobacteria bacterium]|nr:hypothetical protein [Acidobacteriota bacterium]